MTLWLILGAMSAAAVAVLFLALRRGGGAPAARAEHDLAVYRAQLKELERDLKRGVLEPAELESARLEVERRMLAADAARGEEAAAAPDRPSRALSLASILLVPAGAFALYLWIGQPGIESRPFAERSAERVAETGREAADLETMVAGLRARLAEDPDDLEGWVMLGRSSLVLGRMGEAVEAYRRALALAPEDPDLRSALGEARVMAANGLVGPEARRNFEDALALNAGDVRARYYLGLAREQDGDAAGALDDLTALLADSPPDAPWADGVSQQAARIAESLGLDPSDVPLRAGAAQAPRPSLEAAERLAARLASDPKDYEGWIALARMRAALGDPEGAAAALDSGAAAYGAAPFVQQQFRQVAAELGLPVSGEAPSGPSAEDMAAAAEMSPEERDEMIRSMVAGLAARLEDEPEDAEGWRMLARSYEVLGEPVKAAEAYGRVASLRPEDTVAKLDHALALIELVEEGGLPPEAVALLETVAARDPLNRDALFYLGEAARLSDDPAGAELYWTRLLELLPPDEEAHAWLVARIAELQLAE
jgi:cytochrome c-type biogenesis protein CcmH